MSKGRYSPVSHGETKIEAASVRRTPVQERSHDTVQRILTATSRLLERIPLEEVTTSRIAQESGVSIGGLYRFFPDKQAIIDAIAVQHVTDFETEMRDRILELLPGDGSTFLGAVIDAYVHFLDKRPDFRTIAFGRHISADTRKLQVQPDVGTVALVKQFMVLFLGMEDSGALTLKLRIAIETGERLIAFAYEQDNENERGKVIEEMKKILAAYLFSGQPSPTDQCR